jgi:hypothetical protein
VFGLILELFCCTRRAVGYHHFQPRRATPPETGRRRELLGVLGFVVSVITAIWKSRS